MLTLEMAIAKIRQFTPEKQKLVITINRQTPAYIYPTI